ncbi:FUSC family protein [Georgenia sp. Z1491]|uniref:FUSC family protein n=1 Tax=Georgenia sp. Z1491 TaxID=3416707 RepID=UPI003CF36FB2
MADEDERSGRGLRHLALHIRTRLRQGSRRARWAFVPTLVAAAAAAVAFLVSSELLGHEMPIFAPTAAWLCLGFTSDRQLRRVAELGVGCTLGVALGELFAALFGIGPVQVFVVLVVATMSARIVDRGELLTYQAGVQGIVVIAMPASVALTDGAIGRWTDALVGASLAFLVAAFLPDNAIRRPRRRAQAAITDLSDFLRTLGEALRLADPDLARDALTLGRDTQQVLDTWERTVRNARQVIAVNPTMRGDRAEVRRLARASVLADRAVRNARVVARKAESVVEAGPRADLARSLDALSSGLRLLAVDLGRGDRPDLSRSRITEAAHTLDPDDYAVEGWPTQTLVSVLRSLVVDVLQIAGMTAAEARTQLPTVDGGWPWDADDEHDEHDGEQRADPSDERPAP